MKNDILITGGHIIDPARNINEINKLRIINDIIVDADKYPVTSETRIIHADGMIVTPGLIDYHAHVFYDATEGGVRPDMYMPRMASPPSWMQVLPVRQTLMPSTER